MDGRNSLAHGWIMPRLAIVGIVCLLAFAGHTQSPAPAGSLGDRVDMIFRRFDKPDSPGCAVAVISFGSIIYKRGYGLADLDHKVAITANTVFHAASLAKQFTAMSIMLLVQRKQLSLDDDVASYIPELHIKKQIRIRDILSHTSGIRDQLALLTMAGWRLYDDVITQDDVLGLVSRMESLDFDPGEDLIYSNTGYTLAGMIVEKVSGQSLTDFAHDNIFQPLGMNDTIITKTHNQLVSNRAYGYYDNPFQLWMPNFDVTGPTNLLTTVEDLARWDRNFYDNTVGGTAALSQMQTPARLRDGSLAELGPGINYGFGLEITNYRGLDVIEHDGRDAGYRSHLIRFPQYGFSVACLCNLALPDDQLPHEFVRRVADIYLGDRFTAAPPPGEHPSAADSGPLPQPTPANLADLTGRYYSKEINATYEIVLKDSSLFIKREKYPDTLLKPDQDGSFTISDFSLPLPSAIVRFPENAELKVYGLLFTGGHSSQRRIQQFEFDKMQ